MADRQALNLYRKSAYNAGLIQCRATNAQSDAQPDVQPNVRPNIGPNAETDVETSCRAERLGQEDQE